jgi:hypothetical protein
MPGLDPGIHVLGDSIQESVWMAGSSPAMTEALRNLPETGNELRAAKRRYVVAFICGRFPT